MLGHGICRGNSRCHVNSPGGVLQVNEKRAFNNRGQRDMGLLSGGAWYSQQARGCELARCQLWKGYTWASLMACSTSNDLSSADQGTPAIC